MANLPDLAYPLVLTTQTMKEQELSKLQAKSFMSEV